MSSDAYSELVIIFAMREVLGVSCGEAWNSSGTKKKGGMSSVESHDQATAVET
jgi:hypothetical protein